MDKWLKSPNSTDPVFRILIGVGLDAIGGFAVYTEGLDPRAVCSVGFRRTPIEASKTISKTANSVNF